MRSDDCDRFAVNYAVAGRDIIDVAPMPQPFSDFRTVPPSACAIN